MKVLEWGMRDVPVNLGYEVGSAALWALSSA
jgi:hypothetical protein